MRSSSIVRRAPTEVGAAALALLALCCGMADTIVALLLTAASSPGGGAACQFDPGAVGHAQRVMIN